MAYCMLGLFDDESTVHDLRLLLNFAYISKYAVDLRRRPQGFHASSIGDHQED